MANTVGSGRVRTVATSACTSTVYHQGMSPTRVASVIQALTSFSFILKTKEQRAAEKALMDKSPIKTLTLEDFLESERHKLTGTLTPVTPETFAKWKKERLDKKAAEEEARKAKEETGRAMFEKGGWEESGDEESDEEEEETERGEWDLERMRRETEEERERKEKERVGKADVGGGPVNDDINGVDDGDGEEEIKTGGLNGVNGVNGHE